VKDKIQSRELKRIRDKAKRTLLLKLKGRLTHKEVHEDRRSQIKFRRNIQCMKKMKNWMMMMIWKTSKKSLLRRNLKIQIHLMVVECMYKVDKIEEGRKDKTPWPQKHKNKEK